MFLTNRETIDYLTDYPKEHGKNHTMRISRGDYQGKIPMLLQWDERWGYESYGSGLIGWTGCGPTCLSMAGSGTDGRNRMESHKSGGFQRRTRLLHRKCRDKLGADVRRRTEAGTAFRRNSAGRKQNPFRAGRRRCRNLLGGAGDFTTEDIIS